MSDKYLHRPENLDRLHSRDLDPFSGRDLDPFSERDDPLSGALPSIDNALSRRVNADPENVQRGLAQLVLTIIELLRQIMERQALRRIDDGTLNEDQVERLGRTFMALAERMEELRTEFGLDEEDLNLNLGPLGNLL